MADPVHPSQPAGVPDTGPITPSGFDARRRLLRGGLATAPVIATLISRPVLGQTVCATPSLTGSMAASHNLQVVTCAGQTISWWQSHIASWPAPYYPTSGTQGTPSAFAPVSGASQPGGHQATPFHSLTTGLQGSTYGSLTMLGVLAIGEGGNGVTSLGRYIVAALLNARSGRTPVLNETTVRSMWNDVVARGWYEPTPGVRWGPSEIIKYLQTTMR